MKTKEYMILKYLQDELSDINFYHNKAVGGTTSYSLIRPDIRINCDYYQLIVEVDEKGGSYHRNREIEENRMLQIISAFDSPCIFIRYVPDRKESEKEVLLAIIKKYLDLEMEFIDGVFKPIWNEKGLLVEYLFYPKK
jgi:hypothetical protein